MTGILRRDEEATEAFTEEINDLFDPEVTTRNLSNEFLEIIERARVKRAMLMELKMNPVEFTFK